MDANTHPSIVVSTGAGISKESGLKTFRDADGIWATVRIEDVATPDAFKRDPARVQEFYNTRRANLNSDNIRPNAAHDALVRLERDWPGDVLVVTQNVDNLHETAGTENLLHMHGELLKIRCEGCGDIVHWAEDIKSDQACVACEAVGTLRPNVVWFGEMPMEMDRIYAALGKCGLFISIGTSGNVYPAAGFVQHVRGAGSAHTLELNLEPSEGATMFAEAIYGPATKVVPAYVEKILADGW
ncbi:MAG: NAD-dependent protein deacylase [Rhodospirillales bacterium]|nr:NAD-dependent protein deacylase [Rhodospirillales bacterium]